MAHVAAAKTMVSGTVSSLQKKVDKMFTAEEKETASEKAERKERKNNEKELQKKEKEKKKEAEMKEKHEKELLDRQAERAELRLQMRSKYGLGHDKKDEEIITARKSQNEPTEESKNDIPPWMKNDPKPDATEEYAPESQTDYNPYDAENLDKSAESEYEQQLKMKEEEKKLAKQQEKQRKKEEKARQKQEEKEKKEQQKREAKERKGRLKQNMDQWKQNKDAKRSIVDEHQRKQHLYDKYNLKPQTAKQTTSTNPFDEDDDDVCEDVNVTTSTNPFGEPSDSGISSPEESDGKKTADTSPAGDKKDCILM